MTLNKALHLSGSQFPQPNSLSVFIEEPHSAGHGGPLWERQKLIRESPAIRKLTVKLGGYNSH